MIAETANTTMTERERFMAALSGEAVDRMPIWLREGFDLVNGPVKAENFRIGNLEVDELEFESTEAIRQRVREILVTGANRLIIGASAGPTA